MIIFVFIIFLICLYKLRFSGGAYFDDYLSKQSTASVKGLFTLLIVVSHFSSYVAPTNGLDRLYGVFQGYMGQLVVAMFLFYSGYGIMESIAKKGGEYVKSIPTRRFLRVLTHFMLAVLLFLLVQSLLGVSFDGKTIALSLIGWDSLGNSNWYVFDILCAYLITWLAFSLCKNHRVAGLWAVTLLSVAFILFLREYRYSHWYDTFLCYPLGLWYSYLKPKLEKLIQSGLAAYLITLAALAALGLLTLYAKRHYSSAFALLLSPIFSGAYVVFSMKVKIDNGILRFFGDHLFEVYMLQRLPMIVLQNTALAASNKYVYFVVCFAITVVIAALFKKFLTFFDKKTFDRA